MAKFDKFTDVISVEDITDRIEELRAEREEWADSPAAFESGKSWEEKHEDESSELAILESLIDDLAGMGGDHQWGGTWYPGSMIRDSHFRDYAQELAEDIGAIPDNASWPCTCIDWDQAARELQYDYSSIEYEGVTYWVR